jgi:hypothetical protein
MARFTVKYSTGLVQSFTAAQVHQAKQVVNHPGTTFYFLDKEVSAPDWFTMVYAACDSQWEKKNQTHKRVTVLHGSSVADYVTKWVRR